MRELFILDQIFMFSRVNFMGSLWSIQIEDQIKPLVKKIGITYDT